MTRLHVIDYQNTDYLNLFSLSFSLSPSGMLSVPVCFQKHFSCLLKDLAGSGGHQSINFSQFSDLQRQTFVLIQPDNKQPCAF